MNSNRIWISLLLALSLAAFIGACQKAPETDTSALEEENPATMEETPYTEAPAQTEAVKPAPKAEPRPAARPAAKKPAATTPAVPAAETRTVSLPAGTIIEAEMITPVDTRESNVGDAIEAKLMAPLVVNGTTIADAGALMTGQISELQRASRSKSEEDRASVKFAFTTLQTVDGEKTLSATVTNAEGKMIAKSTSTRDKLIIGGSAIAGAIVGKVAGKDTKAAVIGAVGGAVLGTGVVLAAKGHELEVPAGSTVTLRVEEPITIVQK